MNETPPQISIAPAASQPPTAPSRRPYLQSDRLASLSDSMFGVAMTLLATTLIPRVQTLHGSAGDILSGLADQLGGVVLSFAIAANYWVSQQRRLAMMTHVSVHETMLHLLFLFLIILLPLTTTLSNHRPLSSGVAVIFAVHGSLIALLNFGLWVEAHRRRAVHGELLGSVMLVIVFGLSVGVAVFRPVQTPWLWSAGFAIPFLAPLLVRLPAALRRRRKAARPQPAL